MLTGDLVRAKVTRATVEPRFVDPDDVGLLALAQGLSELYRAHVGRARGELRSALQDHARAAASVRGPESAGRIRLERGLSKLLEDRSTFERPSSLDPEAVRALVFERAARARAAGSFERERVLVDAAAELASRGAVAASEGESEATREVETRATGEVAASAEPVPVTPETVERALEADRKVHERLLEHEGLAPRDLLVRYNVALAQAVLLRATRVLVALEVRPARIRHVLRALKFRGLLFRTVELPKPLGKSAGQRLGVELDGPLSLFGASTKYGLALAAVLPAILLCERFDLEAELSWGKARAPKTWKLSDRDLRSRSGALWLRSPIPDPGATPPPELEAFARRFEEIAPGWKATLAASLLPVGDGKDRRALVPDLRLRHEETKRTAWLELVTAARRETLDRRLELLAKAEVPGLVVAVARTLVKDREPGALPSCVLLFRGMPDAREVLARIEAPSVPGRV